MIAEVMKMREEEKKRSSQNSGSQRKKWLFPAIYIAAAALLLTAVLWFSSTGDDVAEDPTGENGAVVDGTEDSLTVNSPMQNFVWPVENQDDVEVITEFYDFNSTEDQTAALVLHENTYRPNRGIDLAMKNGESFNVVAAMAGKVTEVQEDALLGNVIEIEHTDGVVTRYQSVSDIKVEEGDQVKQGDVLAMAGESELNQAAGVHAHFEIRVDGTSVNPLEAFSKTLGEIQEDMDADEEAASEDDESGTDNENDQSEKDDESDENAGAPNEDDSDSTSDEE